MERNVYHQYNLYLIEVQNCCLSRVLLIYEAAAYVGSWQWGS